MLGCDLGSNTLRVVKIDCKTKERVKEFEKIVKTAEGIKATKKISKEARDRIIDAILEAKESFDCGCIDGYRAVATAALRMADNSDETIKMIYEKTGILFEIIDAAKEAEYTRVAVENRLKKLNLCDQSYMLLDLGGGSCEIVVKDADDIVYESFDIGIVTIVEKYGLNGLDEGIKKECEVIESFAKGIRKRPDIFIGSSGTPTTIAAFLNGIGYEEYDYKKINGYVLSKDQMNEALNGLIRMSKSERIKWVGVGRDDLIIAGVKLLERIVEIFGYDELTVIDDGLREGVALLNCK